ncbi:hypothetical protein PQU92_06780 [Asticcacaulis sp. BYS171W]|uniref:Uncharacterized protein n=1 Tax=Asticcacaulis aquaticus TaxID=2984212 RepID=A0ABT5HSP7_9CAUL|nr:hypothetical protein [Asticcacaulis aquaticus]MDC7682973.1 hypothetical protein [Asticcacaulis aquaticus]
MKPYVEILTGGGYRVGFTEVADLSATGLTVMDALRALSVEITRHYDTEKGDESAATETAMRQTDILANDRFIRANQMQQSVMTAMAIGLI